MGNYIYKCVALSLEPYNEEHSMENTVQSYEKVLNETAAEGWDFVKTDTLAPVQKTAAAKTVHTKIFIFRKKPVDINEHQTELNFAPAESKLVCPVCHNTVSANDIYCENCAHKLK